MITKRVLTLKSKVGFGKYPNEEIGRLLQCDCGAWVRWIYYNAETIDYTQEVKDAAGITIDIPKPGVDADARLANERKLWAASRAQMGEKAYMGKVNHLRAKKRKAESRKRGVDNRDGFSKGRMARINQGHDFIKGL